MQKFKEFVNEKFTKAKVAGTMALVPLAAASSALVAHAEGATTDVNSIMSTTATTVSTNVVSMIGTIAPIAGTVVASVLAVTFGFKLIRRFMKG